MARCFYLIKEGLSGISFCGEANNGLAISASTEPNNTGEAVRTDMIERQ